MSTGREPWLAIEMRQLAALDAIARERSFSAAAEALDYVQSAVSQQIVQLERRLGVRLVDRARGTAAVSLTTAGRVVLQHAEAMQRRYDAAERELAALHDGVRTRLRVGAAPGATALLGGADVDVEPTGAEPVALRLVRGELDAALCELPVDDPRLEVVALPADPVVALVPAGSPPARLGRAATPRDLAGLRLVRLDAWAGQDAALAWLGDARERSVHTTDREATVRALVAGGEAFALVPSLVASAAGAGTQVVALQDGPPARPLGLTWPTARSDVPAIRALVATVRRAAGAAQRS